MKVAAFCEDHILLSLGDCWLQSVKQLSMHETGFFFFCTDSIYQRHDNWVALNWGENNGVSLVFLLRG
jgi:hypothetical protein